MLIIPRTFNLNIIHVIIMSGSKMKSTNQQKISLKIAIQLSNFI